MLIVLVALGCMGIAIGGFYARRAGDIERRLREYRTPDSPRFEGRWPAPADRRYQPAGWHLVTALRRAILAGYVFAIAGVVLLMYACPKALQ